MPSQGGVIEAFADEDKLVFTLSHPVTVIDGKALACQVKDMPSFTFVEPEDSFGAKHVRRHLVIEKILKFA